MNVTEKIFIQSLMDRIPGIENWTAEIWDNIDHEYMINTLNEIKRDVILSDTSMMLKYKNTAIDIDTIVDLTENLENIFDINPIEKFREYEISYGIRVNEFYKKKLKSIDKAPDVMQFLTEQIKDYDKINNWIPYVGKTTRYVSTSTYLSMLYNVNLTRTAWNQTFKDADYFNNDLVILETHPSSCPLCADAQGKVYSRTGKNKRYPSIEVAYNKGVGHPNCKCNFGIFWDKEQLMDQDKGIRGNYEDDQKKKAIEREIRKQENNLNLFNMIGNQDEVDKTALKINKLKSKL